MSKGSRKHILDWTSRPEFIVELLQLVAPVDARITARSTWMPRGHSAIEEARLDTFGPSVLRDSDSWTELRSWWLVHEGGANTPNWDLAVACEIEGRQGFILVEAMANARELGIGGKPLDAAASVASAANHDQIGRAINEACLELRRISATTALSRDSHYQLSNRVAFAWKLASLGVPTVLVYLGFLGDVGIANAGMPFTDSAHWQAVFADHAHAVVPNDLFERRIECGPAPTWFLIRSRPVLEISQAPSHLAPLSEQ
jgi:hypothetical protein